MHAGVHMCAYRAMAGVKTLHGVENKKDYAARHGSNESHVHPKPPFHVE